MLKISGTVLLLGLILLTGCMEYEKINSVCEVFLQTEDGSERFYEINEDIRRNKKTGVFTYRDEDGKLWSISVDADGNYWSKSTDERPIRVERIVCGNSVYLEQEEEHNEEAG
ncbi:hypothetical protein [Indibacter alkaliphilus]|nr:hypothetical protein [Indibacter alkaliphilus]